MVELPKKRVGIIACSGEELPEGTVTRLAALKVLEQIHPSDTVTICLPLFLAGGEGDRAFARFYPTIAIDGCGQRCAARATEMYSGKPAASVVVTTLIDENNLERPQGARQLNEAGLIAVDITAQRISGLVDELLEKKWSRRTGKFLTAETESKDYMAKNQESVEATCSCGSGLPVRIVMVEGKPVEIVALSLILEQFRETGKQPSKKTAQEMLEMVKIYQPIPKEAESSFTEALLNEFSAYCAEKDSIR
jgi:uncharacterized metal-binding protein